MCKAGENDWLYEATAFYQEHLANRRYQIRICRKKEERTIECLFLSQHFFHLLGLHKLTDLPFLKRSATNIYREILSKKITYADISKSEHIGEMTDRLLHHREMLNVIRAESLFFRSLKGYFKGIVADCVLTKTTADSSAFGFLFLKRNENVYFPCSFFTRNEQKEYTRDGAMWKILSITEISK